MLPRHLFAVALGAWTVWDAMYAVSTKLGWLGYPVGLVLSPLFAPTALFLPWFDAWLHKAAVNPVLLGLWIAAFGLQVLTGIVTGTIAKRASQAREQSLGESIGREP